MDAFGPVPGLDRARRPGLGEGGEAGILEDRGELRRAQRIGEVGGGVGGVDERLRSRDRGRLKAPALAAAVEAEAGADGAVGALQAAVGVEIPDGLVHRVGQAVGAGVEGRVEHLGALGQAEIDVARGRRQPLVAEVEQPVIGQAVVIGTVVPVASIHRAAEPALGALSGQPGFGIGALLRGHRVSDGRPFARKERRQPAPVDFRAVDAVPESDPARVSEAAVQRDAVALVIFAARRVARDRVPDRLVDAEGVGNAEAGNVDAIEAGLIRPPRAVVEPVDIGRSTIGEVGGIDQTAVAGQVSIAAIGSEASAYRHPVPFQSAARKCRRTRWQP